MGWSYKILDLAEANGRWRVIAEDGAALADASRLPVHDRLTALGAEGWELVSAAPSGEMGEVLYLKRPLG